MSAHFKGLRALICLAAAVVLITGVTASVLAEDQADDDNRLDEAWKDAIGDQENILTEKQFAMLNNLAFQAAVTKVCEGFDLDQSKFAKAITDATTPSAESGYVGGRHQGLGDSGYHEAWCHLWRLARRRQHPAGEILCERERP